MIKEKEKVTKYNYKKTFKQSCLEYLRTIICSVIVAAIITAMIAVHARNDMIKNVYESNKDSQTSKKVAEQMLLQSDVLEDLGSQKYSICMQIGKLYTIVEDYKNAQFAYELALNKTKKGNYSAHYQLVYVLLEQNEFEKAENFVRNIPEFNDKALIKFKTKVNILLGDKYYSVGKFLSAAKSYERAKFYYDKFSKKDSKITKEIDTRILNSYVHASDLLVKSGYNSDAMRYLKQAEKIHPKDFNIRYKIAIVLSDLDPEKSLKYLETLLEEQPQYIDYDIYGATLMKAANIADLDNRPTQAKYYRYRIHSIDLFVNRKVLYKNDIETSIEAFKVKKSFFTYPLKATYSFKNVSNIDIPILYADFVLLEGNKPVETCTTRIATREEPLYMNGYAPVSTDVSFKHPIFTKKELENYFIEVYLYKDKKFKTLVFNNRIPQKSFNNK